MKAWRIAFVVLALVSGIQGAEQKTSKSSSDKETEKPWYEYVFFSPLVATLVGSGMIGYFLLNRGKVMDRDNSKKIEVQRHSLASRTEYQDEATSVLAPIFETYKRLGKLQHEAPMIEDNKLLVERLSSVLESYSRFRTKYSEEFLVFTRRFAPELENAYNYVIEDFCSTLIYISSDYETRNSDKRKKEFDESMKRLGNNIKYIEDFLNELVPRAE